MDMKNMKLKVLKAFNARKLEGSMDKGFIPLKPGSYSFKVIDGEMFQIEIPNGKPCYLSNKKLEEKIKEKAVAFDGNNQPSF
jgi:hypothetical protein